MPFLSVLYKFDDTTELIQFFEQLGVTMYFDQNRHNSICQNIPTVDGQKKVIEVNIFNFDQDIYEQNITVLVYEFIRGEVKFDGLDALKNQLGQDKITASAILAKQ